MSDQRIPVRYARKPVSMDEIISAVRYKGTDIYPTKVIETKTMTTAEYDGFTYNLLATREWLAGKGGFNKAGTRLAIEVMAPDRKTLYIDPSGASYARYIGMWVEETEIRHPQVVVQLTGMNGNASNLLGLCRQAAQAKGVPAEEISAFMTEATAGDYNYLLATCQKWFDCR